MARAMLAALGAVTLAVTTAVGPMGPATAKDNTGAIVGGLVAGAVIGAAVASSVNHPKDIYVKPVPPPRPA